MPEFNTDLEQKTDELLKLWIREMHGAGPGDASSGGYSGEALAITETRNYRSRPRSSKSEEGSARVHAVESRGGRSTKIIVSSSSTKMEVVMAKLKRINILAYTALALSYTGLSFERISKELRCSYDHARRYRQSGFDMVMMEVDEFAGSRVN